MFFRSTKTNVARVLALAVAFVLGLSFFTPVKAHAMEKPLPIIDGVPFDAQWYAEQNPDVVRECGTAPDALWYHYSHYGRYEGRKPFPNDMPTESREEGLIDTADSSQQDGLQYVVPPIPMVARPYPIIDGTPFDAQWYAEQNPDVVREFGTDTDALWYHYSHYGRYEGREPFPNDMVFPEEIQLPDDATVTSNAPKDVPIPVPMPCPSE